MTRRWLPAPLSGTDRLGCLSQPEELRLSHVELGAYAHLLGCLEEFIAPTMMRLARDVELEDRARFEALSNVATEDIKHIGLFREVRARVNDALGFPLALLPEGMAATEKDDAIDDFIELMLGMEGLLHVQARFDVENLLRYIRRPMAKAEQAEILAAVLAAKRYTFIESGLMHPSFRELFSMVATRAQRERVEQALGTTLATAA